MADKTIADIVADMAASTSARSDRDWKKAEKAVRNERINEEVEAAKRVAEATLDARDRRDREWINSHMGSLTPAQFRALCREYGFDPGV